MLHNKFHEVRMQKRKRLMLAFFLEQFMQTDFK